MTVPIDKKRATRDGRDYRVHLDLRTGANMAIWRRFLEVLAINRQDPVDYLMGNCEAYLELNIRPKTEKTDMMTMTELMVAIRTEFEAYPEVISACEVPQNWYYWRKSKRLRLGSDYFPVKIEGKTRKNTFFFAKDRIFEYLRANYVPKPIQDQPDPEIEAKKEAEKAWRESMADRIETGPVSADPADYGHDYE